MEYRVNPDCLCQWPTLTQANGARFKVRRPWHHGGNELACEYESWRHDQQDIQ
jgi:hypothetical protein